MLYPQSSWYPVRFYAPESIRFILMMALSINRQALKWLSRMITNLKLI